ncbi:MAG: hypothetical protein WCG34_05040 [Leptolinea sp.]
MLKPVKLSYQELSRKLAAYEKKYGYSTIEFYDRFSNGSLGDSSDYLMWAGLYHLYLNSPQSDK